MANGVEHAQATRRGGAVLVLASIGALFTGHPLVAAGLAAGAVGGHLATPDLDLPGLTHCELRIYRWNRVAGLLWRVYWGLYAFTVPHRHWLSHMPAVGTLIRMLYLMWWLPVAWWWLAWSVQDALHLHLDGWRLR